MSRRKRQPKVWINAIGIREEWVEKELDNPDINTIYHVGGKEPPAHWPKWLQDALREQMSEQEE